MDTGTTVGAGMKVTCSKDELVSRLGVVARAVSTRTAVQILSGVLLRAESGELRLAAESAGLGGTALAGGAGAAASGKHADAPHAGATVGTRALWTTGLLPVAVRPTGLLKLPIGPGASGWTVGQLQQELNRHGAGLSVDGGFGSQTAAAVRSSA